MTRDELPETEVLYRQAQEVRERLALVLGELQSQLPAALAALVAEERAAARAFRDARLIELATREVSKHE